VWRVERGLLLRFGLAFGLGLVEVERVALHLHLVRVDFGVSEGLLGVADVVDLGGAHHGGAHVGRLLGQNLVEGWRVAARARFRVAFDLGLALAEFDHVRGLQA